jgi:hypothetical protein
VLLQKDDPALRFANQALNNRRPEVHRFASIGLLQKPSGPRVWEAALIAGAAVGAVLLVVALWFA